MQLASEDLWYLLLDFWMGNEEEILRRAGDDNLGFWIRCGYNRVCGRKEELPAGGLAEVQCDPKWRVEETELGGRV